MNSSLDIPDSSALTELLSTVAADRERRGEPGADPLVLDPLADAIDPDLVADFVDSENVAPAPNSGSSTSTARSSSRATAG